MSLGVAEPGEAAAAAAAALAAVPAGISLGVGGFVAWLAVAGGVAAGLATGAGVAAGLLEDIPKSWAVRGRLLNCFLLFESIIL
jgi:hypothetical protein